MNRITSKDGTKIAFDRSGKGAALILVGGAFQYRAIDERTAQLASLLAQHFTVYNYDRRGRGGSTDTQPYAIEREIEDLNGLINEAGGRPMYSACPPARPWPCGRWHTAWRSRNWPCMSRLSAILEFGVRQQRATPGN